MEEDGSSPADDTLPDDAYFDTLVEMESLEFDILPGWTKKARVKRGEPAADPQE